MCVWVGAGDVSEGEIGWRWNIQWACEVLIYRRSARCRIEEFDGGFGGLVPASRDWFWSSGCWWMERMTVGVSGLWFLANLEYTSRGGIAVCRWCVGDIWCRFTMHQLTWGWSEDCASSNIASVFYHQPPHNFRRDWFLPISYTCYDDYCFKFRGLGFSRALKSLSAVVLRFQAN